MAIVDKINIASRLLKQGEFQQIVTEIESTFPPAQHVGDVKFGNLYRYLFQAYLALGDIPSAQSAAKSATFATKQIETTGAYRKLQSFIGVYAYCDFLQMIGENQNAQLVYYDHLLSNRQWDWNKEDCLPVKVVFEEDANGEFWEYSSNRLLASVKVIESNRSEPDKKAKALLEARNLFPEYYLIPLKLSIITEDSEQSQQYLNDAGAIARNASERRRVNDVRAVLQLTGNERTQALKAICNPEQEIGSIALLLAKREVLQSAWPEIAVRNSLYD